MNSRQCRRQYVLKCISFIATSPLSCCFKTTTDGEFIRPGNRDQCFFRESSPEAAAKVTRSCISCIIIAWPQNCSLLYWWWLWESDSLQSSKTLRVSGELHFRINSQILVQFRFFIQKKRKSVIVLLLVINHRVAFHENNNSKQTRTYSDGQEGDKVGVTKWCAPGSPRVWVTRRKHFVFSSLRK